MLRNVSLSRIFNIDGARNVQKTSSVQFDECRNVVISLLKDIDAIRSLAYIIISSPMIVYEMGAETPPQQNALPLRTNRLTFQAAEPTQRFTEPSLQPSDEEETTGLQSIEISLTEQQLTDQLLFTSTSKMEMMGQVKGKHLDYEFDMRTEEITQSGILNHCRCCSDIDQILYQTLNYSVKGDYVTYEINTQNATINRSSGGAVSDIDSDQDVKQIIKAYAMTHMNKIAAALGKQLVFMADDFVSDMEIEQRAVTYADLISNLFGWTSRLPHMMINCFLRKDKLCVVQRGHEQNSIDLTNTSYSVPTIRKRIIRTFCSGSNDAHFTINEHSPARYYYDAPKNQSDDGKTTYTYNYVKGGIEGATYYYLHSSKTQNDDDSITTITYDYDSQNGVPVLRKETQTTSRKVNGKTQTETRVVEHDFLTPSQQFSLVTDEDGSNLGGAVGSHLPGFYCNKILLREEETRTVSETFIYGSPLIDTSFPVLEKTQELSAALRWLNRKVEETVSFDLYNYNHLIDFNDSISFGGNSYFLQSNVVQKTPFIVNKQSLSLVRWY